MLLTQLLTGCLIDSVFTGSTSGVESVKLVNSLIYQNTASDGSNPSDVVGTTVYINDGNGVGSLIVAQDISATNAALTGDLTVNGITELNGQIRLIGPVYDSNTQIGNTEQVLFLITTEMLLAKLPRFRS